MYNKINIYVNEVLTMKTYKKALCGLLSVLMVLSVFIAVPAGASAKETAKTEASASPDEVQSPIKSIEVDDVTLTEGLDADGGYKIIDGVTYYYTKYDPVPNFRFKLQDGKVVESDGDGWIYYNGVYDVIDIETDQSIDNVWREGEYTAKASIGGFTAEFNVTLKENPVKDVKFYDVDVFEGIDCFKDQAYVDDGAVDWDRYEYTPVYTVTFKDGTTMNSDKKGRVYEHGEQSYNGPYITDLQSFDNQWGKGAHKVKGLMFGIEKEFNINVKDNPIKDIEIPDVTLYEGIEVDDSDDYNRFYYFPDYKVTLNDGTVIESDEDNYVEINGCFKSPEYSDDQSEDNVWTVGKHTAVLNLCGFEKKFNIEVKANPVKKVEAEDIEIIKGTNLDDAYYYGDEDDEKIAWARYIYNGKYKVTLNDGTVLESDGDGEVEFNGKDHRMSFEDDQTYKSQWGLGTHAVKGTIFGKTTGFNVKIVETPVKSVEVLDAPVSMIEGQNGEWIDDDDYYFQYNVSVPALKVTFKDGTTVYTNEGDKVIDYKDLSYEIIVSTYQSKKHWKPGNTYSADLNVMGFDTKFDVKILDTPVKEISVKQLDLVENYNMEEGLDKYDRDYKYYVINPEELEYTVTFKDDTTVESKDGKIVYEGQEYSLDVETDQDSYVVWESGYHYTFKVSMLGYTTEAPVYIDPVPVKKIEVEDLTVTEETGGEWQDASEEGAGYYRYDVSVPYKVTFNNGRVASSDKDGAVVYNGKTYYAEFVSDQGYGSPWGLGEHSASISILGASKDYKVTVKPVEPVYETELKVTPVKKTLYVKGSFKLKADVKNGVGATTFKSSNTKVARVSKNGKVTALKKGTATITVTNNGVSKVCKVTVKNPKLKVSKKTLKKGKSFKLKIVGKIGKAKFKSGNKKVASVSKNGKIKAKKKGRATITVTANGVKLKFKVKVK